MWSGLLVTRKKKVWIWSRGKAEEQLGGVKFSRVDFRSTLNDQAVLVKAWDVYAFVFIFAASDLESTNRLIAQAVVKLDMKASGCDHPTGATSQ